MDRCMMSCWDFSVIIHLRIFVVKACCNGNSAVQGNLKNHATIHHGSLGNASVIQK